jgi:predicted metalloprotease with PDZ domain
VPTQLDFGAAAGINARVRYSKPLVCVLLLCSLPAWSQAPESVHYELTPEVETGRLRVEMSWDTVGRTLSAVFIAPRWGTVENVAAQVRDLKFEGGVTGVRKQETVWLLQHGRGATVTCSYEIDPGRRTLEWDAPHAPVTTRSFFHGVGNTFLIVPIAGAGMPERYNVLLRWHLPPRWDAVCSWGSGPVVADELAPADVRNSVYLAGRIVSRTVESEGHKITVALVDRFGFRADEFAALAAKIVGLECRFMGETDFPPLVVAAAPVGDAIGAQDARLVGMGLYRSFDLLAAPASTLNDGFESLFAHELFHHWNGSLLKASEPDKLVYWFIEGFTDYYSLRILYESGYWSASTYAKWINRHLRQYQNNPAINATNEQIAERYWHERDTVGEIPYQRGVLLGLRWHRLARQHGISDGLDRLFKTLVALGRAGGFELSNAAIRETGLRVLGDWFGAEFDRYVTAAETIEVPRDALAPELVADYERVYEYELGFDAQKAARDKRIRKLVRGSAAEKAGLREGDQLVAAKVHADADQQIELEVRRGEQVKSIRYYPRGRRTLALQFHPTNSREPSAP